MFHSHLAHYTPPNNSETRFDLECRPIHAISAILLREGIAARSNLVQY